MSLRRIWKCLKMRYLLVKHVFLRASLESEIYVSDMKISQVQQSKGSTLFSDLVPRQKSLLVGNRSQESSWLKSPIWTVHKRCLSNLCIEERYPAKILPNLGKLSTTQSAAFYSQCSWEVWRGYCTYCLLCWPSLRTQKEEMFQAPETAMDFADQCNVAFFLFGRGSQEKRPPLQPKPWLLRGRCERNFKQLANDTPWNSSES